MSLPLRAVHLASPGGWDFGWCAVDANNRVVGHCMTEAQAHQLVAPFLQSETAHSEAFGERLRARATAPAFTREDAAKIIERKAKALTDEYCRGDSGPGGYVWINKEAEWQVILLEELAEEIRNAKGI